MKIENEVYVLTKEVNGEDVYLIDGVDGYDFDNDIRCALKAVNKITAWYIREDFEDETKEPSNLRTMPLKVTYEW
jgi:hypothetical protein